MKQFIKQHRRLCWNVLIVTVVVLLLGLNILMPFLMQENGDYIDLTPEGLYTLTDVMEKTCEELIQGEVTITFCDDPDRLLSFFETRYIYIMALKLADKFDHIHVETVNLIQNPTAVNRFKATSATRIEANDVIVSSEGRYRILDSKAFWAEPQTLDGVTKYYYFDGEYEMASAMMQVATLKNKPIACVAYGHGEHIYIPENYVLREGDPVDFVTNREKYGHDDDRSMFYNILINLGMDVMYINLDGDRDIPEDCVLLVMDGPTEDYDVGDPNKISEDNNALRRIHSLLSRKTSAAWMLFKDPDVTLPNLEDQAEDWGIAFENNIHVKDDPAHTLPDADNIARPYQTLVANLTTDKNATPYAIYKDMISAGSPPRIIVKDSGTVRGAWTDETTTGISGFEPAVMEAHYHGFMYSSEKSVKLDIETGDYITAPDNAQAYALAGLSLRMRQDTFTDTNVFAYFFGAASTSLTSNEYLENSAYSNYDALHATVRFISRMDVFASMELGSGNLNAVAVGGMVGGKELIRAHIPVDGYKLYGYVENAKGTGHKYGLIKSYPILQSSTSVKWTIVFISIPMLAALVTATVLLVRRKNR